MRCEAHHAQVSRLEPVGEGGHARVHVGRPRLRAVPRPRHQPRQEPAPAGLARQGGAAVHRALRVGGGILGGRKLGQSSC